MDKPCQRYLHQNPLKTRGFQSFGQDFNAFFLSKNLELREELIFSFSTIEHKRKP